MTDHIEAMARALVNTWAAATGEPDWDTCSEAVRNVARKEADAAWAAAQPKVEALMKKAMKEAISAHELCKHPSFQGRVPDDDAIVSRVMEP